MSTSEASVSRSASQTASTASSVAPPANTGEAVAELALLGREEVVRPLDRGAQRLLARVGVAGRPEQIEAAAEALEDLVGPEHGGAGGGELDRERQVVEPAAELRDVAGRL